MSGKIYDISPAVATDLAVYPGDLPYSSHSATDSGVMVSDIHTTLHIGAHVDAPLHCMANAASIDQVEPSYFVGSCQVIKLRLKPKYKLTPSDFKDIAITEKRILIATGTFEPTKWSDDYAAFHPECIDFFHTKGVFLIGIDTPSVDPAAAHHLPAHKRMAEQGIIGLENLYLNEVEQGYYLLIALPLKLRGLEASPVRAILTEV
ncbi:MAG: cyclase family protein [Prevotellaceae bacterium]|jgi:arylformamidase|nr:cyclase family protein [Prevotellaceae bacterium]